MEKRCKSCQLYLAKCICSKVDKFFEGTSHLMRKDTDEPAHEEKMVLTSDMRALVLRSGKKFFRFYGDKKLGAA